MTARLLPAFEPDMWHVFDDDTNSYLDYVGLLFEFDGGRWRAYGSRIGIDFHVVSMEREFPTKAEAVAWLLDGAES